MKGNKNYLDNSKNCQKFKFHKKINKLTNTKR